MFGGVIVGVYLVGQSVGFWGKAGGVPANLVIDLAAVTNDSNYSWRNLAQGNEEQGNMFANIGDKIAALHPSYIRIDNVFGNTSLDATINSILASGAKPFIALSPLPDTPINWPDWELKVQSMIQHISGELGISGVYYEVGNEPDLFGGWKTYGDKNYFELYSHSIIAANRASGVKPFKIGGPATTQLYESWSSGFAKFVLANHLRLDFYSWHKYTTNMDSYENNAINARAWLTESGLPNNLELIISEAGPNSENDPTYGSGFGAIHAIATAATLEDLVGKVFTFEIKDGPKNTWGILSRDGVVKPRYNALSFLNSMVGNKVLVTGDGSWVKAFSKMNGRVVKTLVVNYDPKGTHTEAVPLNFVNLPLGNFEYKRTDWGGGVTRDLQVATTSANWTTYELMNPNTVAVFEVIF